VAAAWLAVAPRTADMAAHAYRAWLFDQEGLAVWNGQWYGGHHLPGYSVLFPALAGLLGAAAAVALAGLASGVALVALARDAAADRPAVAWLAASGAAANLVVGRGPFALGLAFAALALFAARRGRPGWAAAAGAATALSSPVAGLFLAVVAAGWWLARPSRGIAALGAAPVVAGMALALAFPEGGEERFVASAFWPMLAVCAAAACLVAPERRAVRAGALLYLLVLIAAFVLPTPVGQNALRLGVLAGPAVLLATGRGPRTALWLVAGALLYLQWLPAVRAVAETRGDPATSAAYHAPVVAFLARAAAPGDRVEVPMTRNHWEAAEIAPHIALARGWERQLDTKVNALFYDGRPLTPARYEAWLRREGIGWVAVPDAPPDLSARAEVVLLGRPQPFLRRAFRSAHWTVWEVIGAPAPIAGPGRVTAAGPQRVDIVANRPGDLVLRRRWTRYWRVEEGSACVLPAPGGWTAVRAAAAGRIVLRARPAFGSSRCRDRGTGR
jgi:hypothetical protein